MRCLVVADIHYALRQFDWLMSVGPGYDLVIVAGDLLDIASTVERRAQVVVVGAYLKDLAAQTRVIVCSGNHDLDGTDPAGELAATWFQDLAAHGIHFDGHTIDLDSIRITACPWWDGPAGRARIGEHLARDAVDRPAHWIWLYHAPPTGSPTSWAGRRAFGDEALAGWIADYGPDIVFSGHVHQSPFVEGGSWVDRVGATWVFNAGHQIGPVPCHIVVDTDASMALWSSLEGMQEVALDRPLTRPIPVLTAPPGWTKA